MANLENGVGRLMSSSMYRLKIDENRKNLQECDEMFTELSAAEFEK